MILYLVSIALMGNVDFRLDSSSSNNLVANMWNKFYVFNLSHFYDVSYWRNIPTKEYSGIIHDNRSTCQFWTPFYTQLLFEIFILLQNPNRLDPLLHAANRFADPSFRWACSILNNQWDQPMLHCIQCHKIQVTHEIIEFEPLNLRLIQRNRSP